jgi:glycine cleavage system transcriptional repressor
VASFALAAIGKDQTGIVLSVSAVLHEQGCNVEDSSMSLLRGNFAMMIVFTAPDEATAGSLTEALRSTCEPIGITYSVLEVDDRARPPKPTHVVTVYGSDKPGILEGVAFQLLGSGGNITNLTSRLIGADEPVYVLTVEVELSDEEPLDLGGDVPPLEDRLQELAERIGVEVVLAPYDADVL